MKLNKLILTGITALALCALALPSFAEEKKAEKETTEKKEDKEKTVTITGEGKCAKCALKETDSCQNAIEVEKKNGKKVTYYLVQNDVAKEFHKNICKEAKKVTATGTAKKVDGKMQLTATKIEEAK